MTNSYAVGEPARQPRFSLLARPDFVAAVDEFREHFGQEVRSKITEGYTFLGKDKAAAAAAAASRKAHSAHGASPAHSSVSHGSPPLNQQQQQQQQPMAVHSRGSQAAGAAAGGRAAASAVSASNKDGESTLDNLLSYMKHVPKVAANATRAAPQLGKGGGPGAEFQKTIVASQAQSRLDALDIALPAHLSIGLPPVDRLIALTAGLAKLTAQAEQARTSHRPRPGHAAGAGPSDAAATTTTAAAAAGMRRSRPEETHSKPRPKLEPEIVPDVPPAPDTSHSRKRPASNLIFQIRIPKAARLQIIDAISDSHTGKRAATAAPLSSADAAPPSPKRARRQVAPECSSPPSSNSTPQPPPSPRPANGNGRRTHRTANTPSTSAAATSSSTVDSRARRPQVIRRNGSSDTIGRPAAVANNAAAGMTETEIESIRQQSQRLLALMRQFKHSGDAAREKGGRIELEVGHYLESLACCLEDFWCRRVWLPPAESTKNWSTMLGICEHVYKRCSAKDLAPLRGCASLVAAAVHYQLATESLEAVRGATDAQTGGDAAAGAVRDTTAYLAEMSRHEQGSRGLLSAHHVARHFPQTWACCQQTVPALGDFELRSYPHTKRWPPIAYPVGATSNPLDIAGFVRQLCHEFLDRCGVSLQVPKG